MALLTIHRPIAECCRDAGRRGLRLVALLLLLLWWAPSGYGTDTREYQIKAVFLFNFAQFVEWPPVAFADPQAPFVIGVLGEDPFGPLLEEVLAGEKIGGRTFLVHRYQRVEEIGLCHILFISRSEADRLDSIVASLQNRSLLTVCDTEGFSKRGIMIRFFNDKNRIRLRINLDMVKAASLTISSKLLRPAEIVTSTSP